jgi:hypothetical protein
VDGRDPASAGVDTELAARARNIALDTSALGELGLINEVRRDLIQGFIAIDVHQQARTLPVTLKILKRGKYFEQMLLATDGQNDRGCLQRKASQLPPQYARVPIQEQDQHHEAQPCQAVTIGTDWS